MAGWQAVQTLVDPDHPFSAAAVARAAVTAAAMAVLAYAGRFIATRRPDDVPLTLDALIRAGRTLLAGAGAVVLAAAVEAVKGYLVDGGSLSAAAVAQVALSPAGVALAAYIHRAVLDPSPVPSAAPPERLAVRMDNSAARFTPTPPST